MRHRCSDADTGQSIGERGLRRFHGGLALSHPVIHGTDPRLGPERVEARSRGAIARTADSHKPSAQPAPGNTAMGQDSPPPRINAWFQRAAVAQWLPSRASRLLAIRTPLVQACSLVASAWLIISVAQSGGAPNFNSSRKATPTNTAPPASRST